MGSRRIVVSSWNCNRANPERAGRIGPWLDSLVGPKQLICLQELPLWTSSAGSGNGICLCTRPGCMCAVSIPTELRGLVVHEENLRRHCAVVVDHVLVISSYLPDSGKDLDFLITIAAALRRTHSQNPEYI